jgi:hypothetical protein
VSAQEVDVVVKQTTEHDLKRPCFNNGTTSGFCSASATCNISIVRPNGQFLVNNSLMTNNVPFHNYTLKASETLDTGIHHAAMACTDAGQSGQDTFNILVSPSGVNDNSISSLLILSFAFLFSIGIVMFGFAREDASIVMFGSIGLFLFGLYTLLNGVGNFRNELTFGTSLVMLGMAGYISFRAGMELING